MKGNKAKAFGQIEKPDGKRYFTPRNADLESAGVRRSLLPETCVMADGCLSVHRQMTSTNMNGLGDWLLTSHPDIPSF